MYSLNTFQFYSLVQVIIFINNKKKLIENKVAVERKPRSNELSFKLQKNLEMPLGKADSGHRSDPALLR